MNLTLEIAGVVGLGLLLAAFGATSFSGFRPGSRVLLLTNFLGASLLAVYAFHHQQLVFVVLESFWAVAAVGSAVLRLGQTPEDSRRRGPEAATRTRTAPLTKG